MLPYIEIQNISLGPLTIHIWGLMVGIGIFLGAFTSAKFAKRRNLDPKVVWDAVPWIIFGSIFGARLFYVVFYNPSYFIGNFWKIFAIWEGGMSIIGGLIGALLLGLWKLKKKKLDLWRYSGALIFGLPLGLFVGRIGCFLIHLHPGIPTNFFLGVQYPDGIIRHDLGLYLSINGLLLFIVFLIMMKKNATERSYIIMFLVWYGVIRFLLDFLRAHEGIMVDTRYYGLTPAQFFSIFMLISGIYLWAHNKKSHTL